MQNVAVYLPTPPEEVVNLLWGLVFPYLIKSATKLGTAHHGVRWLRLPAAQSKHRITFLKSLPTTTYAKFTQLIP